MWRLNPHKSKSMVLDGYLLPSCFLASMTNSDSHLLRVEASPEPRMSLGTGSSGWTPFLQDDHDWNARTAHWVFILVFSGTKPFEKVARVSPPVTEFPNRLVMSSRGSNFILLAGEDWATPPLSSVMKLWSSLGTGWWSGSVWFQKNPLQLIPELPPLVSCDHRWSNRTTNFKSKCSIVMSSS